MSPSAIVEVGAAEGHNTSNLVRYAVDHDCALHVIDPKPLFDAEEAAQALGESFTLHRVRSLNALPRIAEPDVVLLDGDHNWYTVYHELLLLDKGAREAERPFPTVLVHDVDWPYGRRDLYYDPDAIPAAYRLPHKREGLLPGSAELVGPRGLNAHVHNAIYSHNVHNGVRTAVEDFLADRSDDIVFESVPGNHGLGILSPDPKGRKGAAPLRRQLARLGSARFLREQGGRLEQLRVESLIAAKEEKRRREEREAELAAKVTELEAGRAAEKRRGEEREAELAAKVTELEAGREAERCHGRDLREALDLAKRSTAASERELGVLKAERDAMAAEVETSTAVLQASTAEAKGLAEALHAAEERAAATELERRELSTQLDAQAEALELASRAAESAERERDDLRATLAHVEESAAAIHNEAAELQAEREAMARELQASAEAAHAAEQRAETAERDRSELAATLGRFEESEAAARRELTELQAGHEAMAAVVTTTREALRETEARLTAAELVRSQAQAELTRLKHEARAEARARQETEKRARGLEDKLRAESRQAASSATARSELARELERQRAERELLLEALQSHIDRAAGSRSFRYGHAFFRTLAALSFKRPKQRRTALDLAADLAVRLEDLERESEAARAAEPAPEGKALIAASPAAANLPVPDSGGRGFELEESLRASFRDRYLALRDASGLRSLSEDRVAAPLPRDARGILARPADTPLLGLTPDVVVCVKDALDDVRRCLWSVLHYTDGPFRLIVVDDGSQEPTRAMLEELAAREPAVELLRNEGPDHGYTRAANIGLRASTGDYVVLLNSDTVVTPGWLERLMACGESDEAIGVVGPLSNAATHQSIPHIKDDSGWAVNDMPHWLTPATMAYLVAALCDRQSTSFPFVNGFCYAIKRQALDRVGLLDEELFGSGYCEENDLSVRLHDAGFSLAVAADSYVFHAKSRSYAPEGRKAVAGRNYKRFLQKHGEQRVAGLLEQLEREDGLAGVRQAIARATEDPDATVEAFRAARPEPLEILFVLHGMSAGSSGGGHSIYQEVGGMRRLGIPARIAIGGKGLDHARAAYADADELFVPFRDYDELQSIAAGADVVVATHFSTVALVEQLWQTRADFLPAYYVQDYEPFFIDADSPRMVEAASSYTALPDLLLFAKTHWLCNVVGSAHGVHVGKVEPSIDEDVYYVDGRPEAEGGLVHVAAMIRPRTPRRQPGATLAVLDELQRRRPDRVRITTFGCEAAQLDAVSGGSRVGEHRGILSRSEVAELLRTCDIFLDLSTYQAFGRTALEAMACGATAVVPATGGAREFARHDVNAIIVDSLRPQNVTADLADVVDDPDRLARLKASALSTARAYSILKAAFSQYALLEREHRVRTRGRIRCSRMRTRGRGNGAAREFGLAGVIRAAIYNGEPGR